MQKAFEKYPQVTLWHQWSTLKVKEERSKGGSPGLVVVGDDSCLRGRGFESRRRKLDGHFLVFFHINYLYKLYCLFEKTENKWN